MKKYAKTLALMAMALPVSSLVNATSFDFTSHGSANNTASLSVLSDNSLITATLTAPGENLGALGLDGIGVRSSCCDLYGIQNGEVLRVDFSQSVNIGSLTMRQWESPDRVVLGYGAGMSMVLDADTSALSSAETFALNLTEIDFITITGDNWTTLAFLSALNDVEVSDVPVPAAAWLFGSALLGLVGAKRQRAKA